MGKGKVCISSALRGVPTDVQVIPYGRHVTQKGSFLLDRKAARAVVADFRARKNLMVIDYEHQTLGGGIAPAAGWIKRLVSRDRAGLWAEVEWTRRAKQYMGGCEYRYLSPVFMKSTKDGRVVRLLNAALTNQPAIDGMVPVTAGPERKEERMQKVLKTLGLDGTGGEDEVLEAIGMIRREMDDIGRTLESVRGALGLEPGAAEDEIKGAALVMKAASEEAASLRQRLAGQEASDLVGLAMKEGKVSPAQKDWAMEYALDDAEAFRVFIAKAPVAVPLGEMHAALPARGSVSLCPEQSMVNRALGLSDERFVRFSKKEE